MLNIDVKLANWDACLQRIYPLGALRIFAGMCLWILHESSNPLILNVAGLEVLRFRTEQRQKQYFGENVTKDPTLSSQHGLLLLITSPDITPPLITPHRASLEQWTQYNGNAVLLSESLTWSLTLTPVLALVFCCGEGLSEEFFSMENIVACLLCLEPA